MSKPINLISKFQTNKTDTDHSDYPNHPTIQTSKKKISKQKKKNNSKKWTKKKADNQAYY